MSASSLLPTLSRSALLILIGEIQTSFLPVSDDMVLKAIWKDASTKSATVFADQARYFELWQEARKAATAKSSNHAWKQERKAWDVYTTSQRASAACYKKECVAWAALDAYWTKHRQNRGAA